MRKNSELSRVVAAKALQEEEFTEYIPLLSQLGGAAVGTYLGNPMLGASLGGLLGSAISGQENDKQINPQTLEIITRLLAGKK